MALYGIVLLFLNNILQTEVRSQCRYKVYIIVNSVTIAAELQGRSLRINRVVLKQPTGFLGHSTLLPNFHNFLSYNNQRKHPKGSGVCVGKELTGDRCCSVRYEGRERENLLCLGM